MQSLWAAGRETAGPLPQAGPQARVLPACARWSPARLRHQDARQSQRIATGAPPAASDGAGEQDTAYYTC
jgi:hypothetical protein